MIKKIYLLLILILLTASCGKKGDPTYDNSNSKKSNTKLTVVQ